MSLVDSVFQDIAAGSVTAGALFAIARWGIRGVVHNVLEETLVGKLDQNSHDTQAVLHQVRNSHDTNLREDLDRLQDNISDMAQSMIRTERVLFQKLDSAATAAKHAAAHSERSRTMLQEHIERSAGVETDLREAITNLAASLPIVAASQPPPQQPAEHEHTH